MDFQLFNLDWLKHFFINLIDVKRILLSIAMFSLALLFSACTEESNADHYLFIGTYTGSGSEGIYVYTFNSETGAIDSVGAATGVQNPSYLALSDDGSHLYAVNEVADSAEAAVSGADIHVSPDGKFLYASNRQDLNDIVIYQIDPDSGELSHAGRHDSGGEHPRNFVIDPTGSYLLVANRDTDNVVVFKRDKETGMLQSTGEEIALSKPVCLKLLAMD